MARNFKKLKKKKLGSYPYFTVMLSISLALFVIGLFGILLLHANKLSEIIKDKFEIHAYLEKSISNEQADSIKSVISNYPFILRKNGIPQVRYISKEEAAKQFINETGEDFYKVIGDNPLRASFIIKIDHIYADPAQMSGIKTKLSQIKGIYEVDYKENLISQINKNIKNISFILILFAGILLLTSILLINNTIKLALFSQRFLIRSMQLVGARKMFIQKPFLMRAALQGLISGMIASGSLFLILYYLYSRISELKLLADQKALIIILASLLVIGVFIGLLSSFRAVNRYLNMSLDELY